MLHFQCNFSDITMTTDEACIFTSLPQLGFPIGALLSGILISYFGKRFTSIFGQAFSFTLGHYLIFSAQNVQMLFLGRFICGICQGFCNCIATAYILDLCQNPKVISILIS